MGTRLLLRDARHRSMITPVNPLRLRLIHICPSYRTVYRSFEIILEWVLSIGFVAIGYPERHVRKASHRGSKQQ